MRGFVLLAAALLSLASATPYQKSGLRGGYTDRKIGKRKHLIRVAVNAYTSRGTAIEYAYRRADELCPDGYEELGETQAGSVTLLDDGTVHSRPEVVLRIRCETERDAETEHVVVPPPREAPVERIDLTREPDAGFRSEPDNSTIDPF